MKIVGNQCRIILTTAYPEYALDGYDYDVADYLLKPISLERFTKAIEKLQKTEMPVAAPLAPPHIFVKSEHRLVRINLSDILYIEALRDYIGIHHTGGQKIMSLESLRNMETLLPPQEFIRVHKSFIVALSHISFIEKNRVVIGKEYIPVGESFQQKFFERINRK